jgi:hypothetical protein
MKKEQGHTFANAAAFVGAVAVVPSLFGAVVYWALRFG